MKYIGLTKLRIDLKMSDDKSLNQIRQTYVDTYNKIIIKI